MRCLRHETSPATSADAMRCFMVTGSVCTYATASDHVHLLPSVCFRARQTSKASLKQKLWILSVSLSGVGPALLMEVSITGCANRSAVTAQTPRQLCYLSRAKPSLNATWAKLVPFLRWSADLLPDRELPLPDKAPGPPPLLLPSRPSFGAVSGVLIRGSVKPPPASPGDPACSPPLLSAAVPMRLAAASVLDLLTHPLAVLNPEGLLGCVHPSSLRAASEPSDASAKGVKPAAGDSRVERRATKPAAACVAALPQALVVLPRSPVVSRRGCISGCVGSKPAGQNRQIWVKQMRVAVTLAAAHSRQHCPNTNVGAYSH